MPNLTLSMSKGGAIATDTINMILLIDTSGSMSGTRIDQVNRAFPELQRSLSDCARQNNVTVKLRVIAFNSSVDWKVGTVECGVPIDEVYWTDLYATGGTETAAAIREANKSLHSQYMGAKALRPVVILLTDGYTGSTASDYSAAIDEMRKKLSGNTGREKVTRVAIGVEGFNRSELEQFATVGTLEDQPNTPFVFEVKDSNKLAQVINWVTVSSMLSSVTGGGGNAPVVLTNPAGGDLL